MKSKSVTRSARLVLAVSVAAFSMSGCTDKEALDRAAAEVTAAKNASAAVAAKLADAEKARDAASSTASTLQTELTGVNAKLTSTEAKLGEATTKLADLDAKIAGAEATEAAAKKKSEKQVKELTAHRDELMEWVEKELLPLAEAQDERLVNLKAATSEMAAEVAKVRKLEWKHPVMRRLVAREQVGEWMRRDLKKDLPEDEARKAVASGVEMGLMKPGTDLYDMFSSFMEAGVAAFYKPETKTFYHVAGNDGRGAYPVVFHELVHAMEDQYYHLDVMMRAHEHNSDQQLAIKGLVEGSASFYGEVYEKAHPEDRKAMQKAQMNPEMIKKQQAMLESVPTFFIALMGLYPYNNAKQFVRAMGGEDPAAVDRLFADPPVSTEQVLHPKKFRDPATRDYPHAVEKPDLSGFMPAGWKQLDDDNMGELMVGCLLAALEAKGQPMATLMGVVGGDGGVLFKGKVKKASEGWDGDRYALWINEAGKCAIVWTSVWDSENDATEFVDTYAPLLAQKVTGEKPSEVPSPFRVTEKDGTRVSGVERRGTVVCAVLGAPAEHAEACMTAGLSVKITADPRDLADSK